MISSVNNITNKTLCDHTINFEDTVTSKVGALYDNMQSAHTNA